MLIRWPFQLYGNLVFQHEYTFLMYLSPNWSEERYGETIFVEEAKDGGGNAQRVGNEKYNTLSMLFRDYLIY